VQVALAPASALALYRTDAAKELAPVVAKFTIAGFGLAMAFGLFVSYFGDNWWKYYGVYLTSPIALSLPVIAIGVGLVRKGFGLSSVGGFLKKLLWAGS
jgi:uncharacterized membrane protein